MCKSILSEEQVKEEIKYLKDTYGKRFIDSEECCAKSNYRKLAQEYWPEYFNAGVDIEVHHLNGDRSDNRLCNLIPLTIEEHRNVHAKFFEDYLEKLREQWKTKRCSGCGEKNGFYKHKHTIDSKNQISESLKEYWRKKKEGLI